MGDDAGLQPLKHLLIERTEGNPFFLEESVRTLVELQVLGGERRAYRLTRPFASIQVPATVQAVLAARIDRLPPEDKHLLQTAAVIGTDVPLVLLQAIAELPDAALRRSLTHLQAAEFLYETQLFPELAYTFKHALTHEVAYGSLLHERRRVLHAHIVAALEQGDPDRLADQVERLAHHALRGERWDKALLYCRQASEKAIARSGHRQAVACLEQALGALQHLPESRDTLEQAIDLRLALHHALVPLAELARMLDYLREAEALAEALRDQGRLGQVCSHMMQCFWVMGDHARAIDLGERALALAANLGDFDLEVGTSFQLGMAYRTLGDYRRAMAYLRRNVASLTGDPSRERFRLFGLGLPLSVASLNYLVWCLAELGEFAEGVSRGEDGLRIAEAIDPPQGLIFAYRGIGYLYLIKGDLHKAIPVLERCRELCEIGDLPGYFPWIASSLGYVYGLSGRVAEAIPLLEQAVQQPASTGRVGHALRVAYLGEVYGLAGRMDEAIDLARQALECACEHKERGHQAYTLRLLGAIAAHRDPPESALAETHYRRALALAEELGMRPLQAHCHLGLGALYQHTRRLEQARTELSAAIELYRSMEMTFWLPQAEAALTEVKGR